MSAHFQDPLPKRVRLLILGGGIHGVGILHDCVSRGWQDVHLIEKGVVGCETSSKSTKLIHGGLRYLQHIRDYGLVREALHERHVLQQLAPDIVKPIELLLPILKKGGMPAPMARVGLGLYDFLAGRYNIGKHRKISFEEAQEKAPILNPDKFKKVYSFWDGQTDDLALVKRIAFSARALGGRISEGCMAVRAKPQDDGWVVDVKKPDGTIETISALYVVNALGPWSNRFLEQSGIATPYHAINDKGSHLLVPNLGLKAGLFLQSPEDGRIFFVLPWLNYTLIGTTEDLYADDPDKQHPMPKEISYLLERCNRYLKEPIREKDIISTLSGLRWLPLQPGSNISATSRAYLLGESVPPGPSARGLMITIYGGKYTTYRKLSETIGDRITNHFGEFRPSQTSDPAKWVQSTPGYEILVPPPALRFQHAITAK